MRIRRALWGSVSAMLFWAIAPHPGEAQLKIVAPPSPQPIIHIQISPELQKALEKPRGANSPSLRLEGSIDPRGTMTVGLREEGLQAGNCPGCASGRVQDWKSEGEGVSHLVAPKGLTLSPVNPSSILCRQDARPGRFVCELR